MLFEIKELRSQSSFHSFQTKTELEKKKFSLSEQVPFYLKSKIQTKSVKNVEILSKIQDIGTLQSNKMVTKKFNHQGKITFKTRVPKNWGGGLPNQRYNIFHQFNYANFFKLQNRILENLSRFNINLKKSIIKKINHRLCPNNRFSETQFLSIFQHFSIFSGANENNK